MNAKDTLNLAKEIFQTLAKQLSASGCGQSLVPATGGNKLLL